MLATACQMFMGKSETEIAQIALETLEGHQRAIIAHLTVELYVHLISILVSIPTHSITSLIPNTTVSLPPSPCIPSLFSSSSSSSSLHSLSHYLKNLMEIYQDRKKFSEQVFKVASSDLVNMGIGVVSYTLKDVHDDQDYLISLGKARTAQVQRDARIGEAQFKRDAVIKEAHAMQEKVSAQYKNEIEMAKAQRDYELKKAAYDVEVNTKKAESEMAYQLQVAKTKQRIEEEKMQVQVVERTQQITLQEQEITRREKELEAKIRKPAEAERYRIEKLAEAERLQLIMEAEAEAESIRMRGEAEAFAMEAKGRAEAEQMSKKAEAFKQYKEGAMVDMLLEKLPLMAEEISKPLCAAQKVTMVSSGGSEVGAAKLTGEVLEIMTHLPATVEKLTGINISQVSSTRMG
ncbi:flotillin-1-like isoform X3 [Myxocyprinus asiaticus]|nr:flotillin-1-like isoform X3 [Myxocyprinus asiaticus]XP_051576538.1 flotillin-1-like isoform X3 [Myxocyprinus asiaticus]